MASASSSTTVSSLSSFSTSSSSNNNEDDEIERPSDLSVMEDKVVVTGGSTKITTTTKQLINLNSQQATTMATSQRPTAIPVVSLKPMPFSSSSQQSVVNPTNNTSQSSLLLNKQTSSESTESDLTELSWLTNSNIPLFGPKNNCLQPLIVPPATGNGSRTMSRVPLKNHKSRQTHPPPPQAPHGLGGTTNGRVVINGIYAHKLHANNNNNNTLSANSTSLHLKSSTPSVALQLAAAAAANHRSSSSSNVRSVNTSSATRLNKTSGNSGSAVNISSNGQVLLEASNTNMSNPATTTTLMLNGVKFKNSCGLSKPALTLSCIIFMSIEESSADKCLQVRQIYEWIQENFPYYRLVSNPGWKSSVRHNLSFSKCFKKMDRASVSGGEQQVSVADDFDLNASRKRRREQQQQQQHQLNSSTTNGGGGGGGGTYWKVNKECKLYLIHMLRKSSFWYHNSKYYSNLAAHMDAYLQENLSTTTTPMPGDVSLRETRIKSQHYKYHNGGCRGEDEVKNKKAVSVTTGGGVMKLSSAQQAVDTDGDYDEDGDDDDDDDDDSTSSTSLNLASGREKKNADTKSDNLLYEFMQKQQQSLLLSNRFLMIENEKENDEKRSGDTMTTTTTTNTAVSLDEIEKRALASFVKSSSSISPRESSSTSSAAACTTTANNNNNKPSLNQLEDHLSLSSSTSSLSSAFALLSASLSKKNNYRLQQQSVGRRQQPATSETNPKVSTSKRRKTVEEDQQKDKRFQDTIKSDGREEKETPTSTAAAAALNGDDLDEAAMCNQSHDLDDDDEISSDLEMEVASTLIGMKWSSSLMKK